MRRECRERFLPPPISKETDNQRSRHAPRHVRDARAVMHVGIAHLRWRGKRSRHSRRMRTRNFTYLARGPWSKTFASDEWMQYICNSSHCLRTWLVVDRKIHIYIDQWYLAKFPTIYIRQWIERRMLIHRFHVPTGVNIYANRMIRAII